MILLYALCVALFIVGGQALWKLAVARATSAHINIGSFDGMLKVLTSPPLLFGMLLYGVATVAYIYLLSKYKYYQVQSIVVGGSLILTMLVAHIVFKENISLMNIIGVCLITLGALLVVR